MNAREQRLKITVNEAPGAVVLKLEGKLVGPVTEELKRTGQGLVGAVPSRKVVIDLRGLTFADGSGLATLGELRRLTEARFEADSPLTRYFAEKARTLPPAEIKGAA